MRGITRFGARAGPPRRRPAPPPPARARERPTRLDQVLDVDAAVDVLLGDRDDEARFALIIRSLVCCISLSCDSKRFIPSAVSTPKPSAAAHSFRVGRRCSSSIRSRRVAFHRSSSLTRCRQPHLLRIVEEALADRGEVPAHRVVIHRRVARELAEQRRRAARRGAWANWPTGFTAVCCIFGARRGWPSPRRPWWGGRPAAAPPSSRW